MKIHMLKCSHDIFIDMSTSKKMFDVRLNDRNYQIGDRLDIFDTTDQINSEVDHIHRFITYILIGGQYGIEKGYVVLGLSIELGDN